MPMSTEKKQGFMLFIDQKAAIDCLDDEAAGKLFKAIYSYTADGIVPASDDRLFIALFRMIQSQIDRSSAAYAHKCKQNSSNAQRRWNNKNKEPPVKADEPMPSHTKGCKLMQSHTNVDNTNNNPDVNPIPDDASYDDIITREDDDSFEKVWTLYGKPIGNKKYLREMWNSLSDADKKAAMSYIPDYVESRPNPKYRRNFENFLSLRIWETEQIINENNDNNEKIAIKEAGCQGRSADKRTEHEKIAAESVSYFDFMSQSSKESGSSC